MYCVESMHVGLTSRLCEDKLILFILFMDRISWRSHGVEGAYFSDLRLRSLFFADDVVLLASSDHDLQLSLDWVRSQV